MSFVEDLKESLIYSPPLMPDLPPERVSEGPPFAITGVDFAGPLYVMSHVTRM